MKRMWIGVGLLIMLLVVGILVGEFMERSHCPGAKELERAAAKAEAGDWAGALQLSGNVQAGWRKNWRVTAAVAAHEPMDEIDGLFAELGAYAAAKDTARYSGACAHLASLLDSMGKAHSFNWWNLF